MKNSAHALFKQFPLNGKVRLSLGELPTPYHIYAGSGVFIGGECDLTPAQQLLKDETLLPLQNQHGRALMGIWVCDFTEASLGPHHELQFSFFVSKQALPPVPARAFQALALILTRPEVQMLCYGLWNNTAPVIAYNREYLSLDARLADSQITRAGGSLRFAYTDALTHAPIFSGEIHQPQQASWRAGLDLIQQIGWRGWLAAARQPWVHMQVCSPVAGCLQRNAAADTFTKNDFTALRYFTGADRLKFSDPTYQSLNFQPQYLQYFDGTKMVFLQPQ